MKKSLLLFIAIAIIPVSVTIALKTFHLLHGFLSKTIILLTWVSSIAVGALLIYKRMRTSTNINNHQN